MSPQEMEYDVAMKTRTNLCRNIGALNGDGPSINVYWVREWSKHSQKRKLWVCLQYGDREMFYSHRNVLLSFIPHLEVFFSFSVFIPNAHCTSINECMRTSKLSD